MKRNILLAMLVAAASATVSLAGAPAAWADVECRYAPPPKSFRSSVLVPIPLPPSVLQPNQVLYVNGISRTTSYRAAFTAVQPQWSVVGISPSAGFDYNLTVTDCDWNRRSVSLQPGALVDFVAVDGNQPMPGKMSATVNNPIDGVGTFAIEYSTSGPILDAGTSQSLLMRGTPALVRDVYVPPGETAVISLRVASGDADLAVVASTADSWLIPRSQAIQTSTQPGLTEDRVAITAPAGTRIGQTFGVVVINNAPVTEATLTRY